MLDDDRWERLLLHVLDRFPDDLRGEREAVHVYAWLHKAVTGPLWPNWLRVLNLLDEQKEQR